MQATEKQLKRIQKEIGRRTKKKLSDGEIGRKVGRHINRWKVAKLFQVHIENGGLSYEHNEPSIRKESELDGFYVIRTSEKEERLSPAEVVRSYKNLSQVEYLFRTLKGITNQVRPIRHRLEPRVRAHIFLCMLAYYVEWHMRKKLKEMIFDDEELDEARVHRDPVKQAVPSDSAKRKKSTRRTEQGFPVKSFPSLLNSMMTIAKNKCILNNQPDSPAVYKYTKPSQYQQRIFDLLQV